MKPKKVGKTLGKLFNKSEKMVYNAMIIWGKDMDYLKLNSYSAWMKLKYGDQWKKVERRLANDAKAKV